MALCYVSRSMAVERIEARLHPLALDLNDRPEPAAPLKATVSAQHCAAMALLDGAPIETALVRGVAAGAANALALAAGMLDPQVARELEDRVSVTMAERRR